MAWKKKVYKNVVKPVANRLRKRYVSKKSKAVKVGQIAKDVMYLKSLVNAEKKYVDTYSSNLGVGANYNSSSTSGAYLATITPTVSQGDSASQRNGNSIRVHSFCYKAMVAQQTNTTGPLKIKIQLWTSNNDNTAPTLATLFNNNPFSGVIDFYSERNQDYYKNFRCIASQTKTIRPDQYSGMYQITQALIARKLKKHHIRYSGATNTITSGEIYITIRADWGDSGTAATGSNISHFFRMFYYDN